MFGGADSGAEFLDGLDNPLYAQRFGMQYQQSKDEIQLLTDAAPPFDGAALGTTGW